ncbi:MAG TPA: GDP-mannose 4,6-dehydratase, partial [Thermoplasmata archaeon]|nr:GDP-mannose 4,6-dehydratase [Thermoplasmata archaeon]
RVREVGSYSATPIGSMPQRIQAVRDLLHRDFSFYRGDMSNFRFVEDTVRAFKPDTIVHLAEQRSAPYSMIDVHHAVRTQVENLTGTLHLLYAIRDVAPDTHLVKMGTMGEYGTPNVEIPEGFFDIEYRGRQDRLPFPRSAGSWYHWSKVFDSGDVMFATKIWNLKATDVMQGVIYGTRTPEITDRRLLTRFDFDETWGTALNRFAVEAVVGLPITPYGEGFQSRGFIALEDSIQSLRLAVENPPTRSEYRVFNQFDAAYTVNELAEMTRRVGEELGLSPRIEHPPDPRVEAERHFYQPVHEHLPRLGYTRSRNLEVVLREILQDLKRYRRRLEAKKHVIMPAVQWREADNRAHLSERASPEPAHQTVASSVPSPPTPSGPNSA